VAEFLQALTQGLLVGSTYGLLALGMGLVYGVSGVVNFAHGDFIALGMFMCLALYSALSLDPYVSIIITVPVMMGVGALVYRYLLRPMVGYKFLMIVQLTLGLSLVLQNGILMVFGGQPARTPSAVESKLWILGEVVMRGNNVMKGYFEQPEATAEAFQGGWFHSGDLAVWHPDGYIELRDRKKDIIISGGENISTIEVEQAVAKHPAVLECAVVAIPDEKWGERPKAFVTLKPGAQATEAEIIEHCRKHIAHFKCPAAITFGDLPKTSTGKIQKFVLRNKEWGERTKRIN